MTSVLMVDVFNYLVFIRYPGQWLNGIVLVGCMGPILQSQKVSQGVLFHSIMYYLWQYFNWNCTENRNAQLKVCT